MNSDNGRQRRRGTSGFTLAEMLAAVGIVTLLTAVVGSVIVGSMGFVTRTTTNLASQARTQTVLSTFQSELRDSARIVSGDGASIVFDYQRGSVCERHRYLVEDDTARVGREQLRHQIVAVPLPDGVVCGDVAGLLDSRLSTSGFDTNRVELDDLGSVSGFTYQNVLGQTVTPALPTASCPGTAGRQQRPSYVDVGSVQLLTDTSKDVGAAGQVSVNDQVRAAVRSNTMGLSCR